MNGRFVLFRALALALGPALAAASAASPAASTLLYSSCTLPACTDSQLRSFDLASGRSSRVALAPPGLADFFESNTLYVPAERAAVMSMQHYADFTGALVVVDVAAGRVAAAFNASRCVAVALDPQDASRDTVACLSVDLGGACGGAGVQCLELRHISRSRGADTLVAAFARQDMPFQFATVDSARGVLVASFEPVSGAGNSTLVELDLHSGAIVRERQYAFSLSFASIEFDAASGRVFCVGEDDVRDENFFGVLDLEAATAMPLSVFNATWVQYSSASALDAAGGLYYMTAFSTELHLLGLRLADGAIVYDRVVENPFVDLQIVAAAAADAVGEK